VRLSGRPAASFSSGRLDGASMDDLDRIAPA
jgi:hypothetical protein